MVVRYVALLYNGISGVVIISDGRSRKVGFPVEILEKVKEFVGLACNKAKDENLRSTIRYKGGSFFFPGDLMNGVDSFWYANGS